MRIGVISDTHGRAATVRKVLDLLAASAVDLVLHCGDIDDADTVLLFKGFEMHFVFGNCDCDQTDLRRAINEIRATLHEHFGSLELEGRQVALIHGHEQRLFQDVERSGHYDFLFYGHTHQAESHQTGRTRVVNPGALHRARTKTFLVLDLPGGEMQTVQVD